MLVGGRAGGLIMRTWEGECLREVLGVAGGGVCWGSAVRET